MRNVYRRLCVLMLLALCLMPLPAQGVQMQNMEKFKINLERAMEKNTLPGVEGTFEKGDRGSDVTKIKERLQKLGYYREDATFGDDFNETMVKRVKLFQENNSLEVTGEIDSETLNKLKTSSPVPGEYYTGTWTEPDVTLIIPENTYGQWEERSGNRFSFRIKVKNISLTRTVKAVEFYVHTKDIWGDELISEEHPYSFSGEIGFKPGEMGYTGYMLIPDCDETKEVSIAIHKVRYSDGTTKTVSTHDYRCWDIEWN